MAYANKVSAVVAVLFLAVVITPRLAESQTETPTFPKMTPECAQVLPDLLECFRNVTPTEECCSDLKSATTIEVTCLCDNYIAHPEFVNITKPYADKITTKCGTLDKFSCGTTTKGGEDDGSSSDSSRSNKEGNGGNTNKVAASMSVVGVLASLFFLMF